MSSLFDIGLSGLSASKYAMYLTSNNIANANNPYFTRREVNFYERNSRDFGNGVTIGDIRRITNDFIEQQLLSSKSASAKSSNFYNSIKNIETAIDNDETSVGKFINTSLSALQSLNSNPSTPQGRSYFLNQLSNMANRIKSVGSYLQNESSQSRKALEEQVSQANQLLQELSQVNQKIKIATGSDKLSLQDTQDQLLNNFAQLIDFSTQTDDEGAVRIQLKNGMPLLQDSYMATLVVSNDVDGEGYCDISIKNPTGTTSISSLINGGSITGLMDYTHKTLNLMQQQLDKLAVSMAFNFNQQNKLGINAQGTLGSNLFNDPNAMIASQNRIVANPANQGSGVFSVQINQTTLLEDSDYSLNFDTPTHYSLVRNSDGVVVNQGIPGSFPMNISADGFTIDISSGTFAAGDRYFINPTKNGASQLQVVSLNTEALALGAPVTTSASLQNNGTGQIDLQAVVNTNTSAFSIPGDLNPPIAVVFLTATTYRLVSSKDGSIMEDNISYNPLQQQPIFPTPNGYDPGYRVNLSGPIQAGDSFAINYNSNGVGDNRNGLVFARLYTMGLVGSEGDTFAGAYQDLLFNLSSAVSSAKIDSDANQLLSNQAQTARDEISSVSLEEETLNLTRMQESYLANAQILDAMKQTMDTIFALLRR